MMPDGERKRAMCRHWRTFPTHKAAERWMRLMRSEEWMHVYLCDECYKWHAVPNDKTLPHA